MSYREPIKVLLHSRFPDVNEAQAFDCHSAGMLSVLSAGYTGLNKDEVGQVMYKGAFENLNQDYQQNHIKDDVQADRHILVSRKSVVSFPNLDLRYINYLTVRRRKIWNLRRTGMSIREISVALNKTYNDIAVELYHIREGYKRWLKRLGFFGKNYLEHVPNLRHYRQAVMLRYVDGFSIPRIAMEMGITPNHAHLILWRARKYLNQKGIHIYD